MYVQLGRLWCAATACIQYIFFQPSLNDSEWAPSHVYYANVKMHFRFFFKSFFRSRCDVTRCAMITTAQIIRIRFPDKWRIYRNWMKRNRTRDETWWCTKSIASASGGDYERRSETVVVWQQKKNALCAMDSCDDMIWGPNAIIHVVQRVRHIFLMRSHTKWYRRSDNLAQMIGWIVSTIHSAKMHIADAYCSCQTKTNASHS